MATKNVMNEQDLSYYDQKIKQYAKDQDDNKEVISASEPTQEQGEFWLKEYQ